jgi:hypothetical protein
VWPNLVAIFEPNTGCLVPTLSSRKISILLPVVTGIAEIGENRFVRKG